MDKPTCSSPSTSAEVILAEQTDSSSHSNDNAVRQLSNFDMLPENTIRQIYANLQYNEVLRSHRLCKRIRSVLQRNAQYLSRPRISELSVKMGLVEKRNRPVGRLQMPTSVIHKKMQRRLSVMYTRKRQYADCQKEFVEVDEFSGDQYELSTTFLHCIDEHLKKLVVDGRMSFIGIAVDTKLYKRLMQKWVKISDANSLLFTLCRFRLESDCFRDLLLKTNCQRLNIELSHFDEQIVNDYVLESMPQCIEFVASGTYPKYFAGLTDRILNHWATQKMLPKRISLQNVYSNFTLEGVLTMINALHAKIANCNRDKNCLLEQKYEWNFGCVSHFGESGSLLEMLSLPGHVLHTTHCDSQPNTIEVTLTSKWAFNNIPNRCTKCSPIIRFQLALNRIKTN